MTSRFTRVTTAAALLLGAIACSGDKGGVTAPPMPEPGLMTLRLASPNTDDGALLLSVIGPGPFGDVAAAPGTAYIVHSRVSGSTLKVAVFGAISSGDIVRIGVPDLQRLSSYQVAVLEVASRTNGLRDSSGGYTLSASR